MKEQSLQPKLTKIEAHQFKKRDSDGEYAAWRSRLVLEPEGAYESNFKKFSATEKHEKLLAQIESSAEMTVRLEKYVEANIGEIDQLPDEEVYGVLCEVAFGTRDENEIEKKYALSQRRGFKLSIVHFLESKAKLVPFITETETDPKAFAEKYLKEKLTGDVSIERLPLGFIIYLDEEDYALFGSRDKSTKSITSAGLTLSDSSLPDDLKDKIILINKGGKEGGITTEEVIANIRKHEIRHILFSEFHEQQNRPSIDATKKALGELTTEQGFENISKGLVQYFIDGAKDEIIAHCSEGRFAISYSALRFHYYGIFAYMLKKTLSKKSDMKEEVRIKILDTFITDQRKCFETVRRMKFVAESMYKPGDENKNNFSEALLRNIPGDKIHRLAKYTEFSEEDIKSDRIIKEKDNEVINELSNLPVMPQEFSDDWWDQVALTMKNLEGRINVEMLPVLLKKITEWSERQWGHYWIERAVSLVKDFVELLGANSAEREKIKQVMEVVLSIKPTKDKKSKKIIKELAIEVLVAIEYPLTHTS